MISPTTDREAWLAERRHSIGASDVAAAIGLSPWKTPIELWQEKTGRAAPTPSTWRMRAGLLLEPAILDEYETLTGNAIAERQASVTHPDYPWLTATLDGLVNGPRVVEAKTATSMEGWGEEGTGDVPDHYFLQVQAQLACAGADAADMPVLFGLDRFRLYTITRAPAVWDAMFEDLDRFWRCVQTDTPPDWGRMDAKALAVLHPECEGTITLDAATQHKVLTYESLGETLRAKEAERETLKGEILAAIGDAQFGELSDGRRVKRFLETVHESTRTVTVSAHVRHYFKITKGKS